MNKSSSPDSLPGLQLAELIAGSNRFNVKNELTAKRVAQALDRYIFSITRPHNDAERVVDQVACFNESGLATLLAELTVKGEEVRSDADKLKILLSLQAQALSNLSTITSLNEIETRELSVISELQKSQNPIPSYSSIKELVFVIFFIVVVFLAVVANM